MNTAYLAAVNLEAATNMRDTAREDYERAEKLIKAARRMAEDSANRWRNACALVERYQRLREQA